MASYSQTSLHPIVKTRTGMMNLGPGPIWSSDSTKEETRRKARRRRRGRGRGRGRRRRRRRRKKDRKKKKKKKRCVGGCYS